tara:strand:- start:614 stop:997 length:384 start_codon:yes stop_codon:yes gene_type:complete
MIYFSIDYRSPPSGLGQIIDTRKPEKVTDRMGNEVWNYTLVTYPGCGSENDPAYILTAHFSSLDMSKLGTAEGWDLFVPVFEDLITYLRRVGVTYVYDIELAYEEDGADDDGYFSLEKWVDIVRSSL